MAPCHAMICHPVTLSGDAEWPKVADAVIEAIIPVVYLAGVKVGSEGVWENLRILLVNLPMRELGFESASAEGLNISRIQRRHSRHVAWKEDDQQYPFVWCDTLEEA